MFFRRALLVGGSAAATAALLAAVAVGKNGGTSESDSLTPPVTTGKWDRNWDRREPMSMVNLQKINGETGEEELNAKLTKHKAKATRHIFLIRHSQYRLDGKTDEERVLTSLGREQAELTGRRLESLGLKYTHIVHSSMTRAKETTEIISKFFPAEEAYNILAAESNGDLSASDSSNSDSKPDVDYEPVLSSGTLTASEQDESPPARRRRSGVKKSSSDLLREGAPIRPDPPVCHWKPDVEQYYEDGARIEAAFRNLIHRADPKQEEDSYEIIVCHANVIRYMVC
ncbi:hypothetical protein AB205_0014690, partial [Aquarana catesbeiana]